MTQPLSLTALAAAAFVLCAMPAQAKTYVDNFSFSTQDQSLWSPGGQASWAYDSGFLGGNWGGGYDNSSPVRFGLDAITGSSRERVPGTGGRVTVRNPLWTAWNEVKIGDEPSKNIRIDNPIPAAYVDTRTGGRASVLSSGQAGLRVTAGANGGGVDVTLPFTTRLSLPDKIVAGQTFTVLASGSLSSGARMSIDAPSINASINGIVGTTNTLSGKACGIGLGCAEDSTQAKITKTEFNILRLDTSRDKPATALGGRVTLPVKLGEEVPIRAAQPGADAGSAGSQTVGHVTVYAPKDASGGKVEGNTLRLETNQTLLRATADLGGIAQLMVPVPLDVLQPSLGLGIGGLEVASIGGTLLNAQVGAVLGLSQRFSFEMQVMTLLSFDTDVFDTNGRNLGKEVSFGLGKGKSLVFNQLPSQIRYGFGLQNRFGNDTGLSLDPLGTLKAGCFNLSLAGGDLADIEECALDEEFRTTNLVRIPVYQRSFALQGFDVASFSIAGAELAALTGGVPTPVPEPSTYAMLLLGLGVLGATARRRARQQRDTPVTPRC